MKIIYLHQYFTTPEYAGGVRSYQFAKRMVNAGHQVDLITSTAFFPVKKSKRFQFISHIDIEGINVHAIHVNYGNKMSFPRRVWAFFFFMMLSSLYMLKLRGRDIIFATSTPLTIGLPALIGKWRLRIPLVFEVRDLWPDVPIAMGYIKNGFVIKLLRSFERCIYQNSAKVVALSTGMAQGITSKGIPSEKVVTVPNASDLEEFAQQFDTDPFIPYRTTTCTKICVYAGTFGFVNDLGYLVQLAKKLKRPTADIKVVLIGDGAEKEKITSMVKALELNNNVIILPPVKKAELIRYIQHADACISTVKDIPALFNNSANKFFDALAAGKPIIINHEGWQAETIRENDLGVVLNRDFEQSASTLIEFFNRNEDSKHTQKRITQFAESHYARDLLFEKLMNEAMDPAWREQGGK